jgi:hypothetical protein
MCHLTNHAERDAYEDADAELRKLWEDLDAQQEADEAGRWVLDEVDYAT